MSSSDHFSMKLPPKFEKDEEYESWKRDLFIWRELTDLAKFKHALAVHHFTERACACYII